MREALIAALASALLLASAPGSESVGALARRAVAVDEPVEVRVRAAIRNLPVARETRAGYDRDKFNHWIDSDDDCQDTRDEVLAAESLVAVEGCDIQSGQWYSWYDGEETEDSTSFDVDHFVALAEAWDSGAKRWTNATRERFANDLRDGRSLVAVSASSNRSKGDRDPAEWLPALHRCRYVARWVAVKIRWKLRVDTTEQAALADLVADCDNRMITVRTARVRLA